MFKEQSWQLTLFTCLPFNYLKNNFEDIDS